MRKLSSQSGSAIIIALFVMSLAAAAAVIMISRTRIDVQRTELILNADQENLYAQGSIDWAIEQLKTNVSVQKPNQLTDKMPLQSKTDKVNGFEIASSIEDMQAFFNLNNLSEPDYQKNFLRLLHAVDPKMSLADLMQLVIATQNWVSPARNDTLDAFYAKQKPAYHAPHHLMASVSELRLVKGMTPALYKKILPYLTALPETTAINVNTAAAKVFASLSPTFTADTLRALELKRQQTPFLSLPAFMGLDIIKNNPVTASQITIMSSYFLVKTSVKVGHQEMVLNTLLVRSMKNSKPDVTTLWQTKGTL
jgi:general secretion pathway protein K